jgi:3-(3-hydroxy-phenyl)propionate hydroxylase
MIATDDGTGGGVTPPSHARALEYDVVVVGLGPVGAAAAQLLAREGLRVLAAEQSLEPYDRPRAIGIDHESLRTLQKICNADDLSRVLGPYRTSEYRTKAGEVLRRIIPEPEPHQLAWPPYNTFVQPELENLLRASFSQWRNLEVRLGWRCENVEQDDTVAVLTLRNSESGVEQVIYAQYVIACDGASSPIREALGLKLEDLDFDEPWLIADVLVNASATLPDVTVQYCDPDRPCTFIAGPRDLRRWEIMLLPGEVPSEMLKETAIWSLLSRWLKPEHGRIWRAATYRFHALVSERWHSGRIFLAGDSAHQTPPFMAQGLNQGIRDVANLCWKIAQCLRFGADTALLQSYDAERRPNARAVIDLTKTFGKLICERDPSAAAARNERLLDEMRAGNGEVVRQNLLPPLKDGFLQKDINGQHPAGVGRVFPQPWIKTDRGLRRMDDVLEGRFLMFVDPGWSPSAADQRLAQRLGIAFVSVKTNSSPNVISIDDEAGLISNWMQRNGAHSVLVRPDHIVFAITDLAGEESGILTLLERALRGFDLSRTAPPTAA